MGSLTGPLVGEPTAGLMEAHADVLVATHAMMIILVRTLAIPFAFIIGP
ncbi:MAG: hypothetical protein ABI328_04110 [Gemmatimonadaceae bacterium]